MGLLNTIFQTLTHFPILPPRQLWHQEMEVLKSYINQVHWELKEKKRQKYGQDLRGWVLEGLQCLREGRVLSEPEKK